jgi:predicted RNA-binding protein with TRAM domain
MTWHYMDGQERKTVEQAGVAELVLFGKLTSGTYIWKEGMAEWQTAGEHPELRHLFAASTSRSTPPPLPQGAILVAPPAASKTPVYVAIGAVVLLVAGAVYYFAGPQAGSSAMPSPSAASSDISSVRPVAAQPASGGAPSAPRPSGGATAPASDRPMPVEMGKEYEVTISDASRRNPDDGVARIQGLVVFVPSSKVGDRLRVRITRVGRSHAEAEVVERL